jgi:outer membrane protein assembly factor BamB
VASIQAAALLLGAVLLGTGYPTYHFDNARTGWNNGETALSIRTVPGLKKYADYGLDGEVDAQPLYLHAEYVPAAHRKEPIVYVTTENDTLYAFSPAQGLLWKRHFGTPVPATWAGNCIATAPVIGITSTPVIDVRRDTLYLVAYTLDGGKPAYTLHAVSPATGEEKATADISNRTGDTSVHRQRAGLLESSGSIYVAFAGFCDHHAGTTYGRILAYSADTLAFEHDFITTRSPRCGNVHMGTIWGEGFAPAADGDGNVYFSTGNGCIDYGRVPDGGYADAVLRLTPGLSLTSTGSALFAPCTAVNDNRHDQEMGSGGVVLVPGTRFAIAGGKNGMTYVLDRAHLGGFHTPCPDRVVYELQTNWGVWGGPVVWKSGPRAYVAIPGTGPHGVREFELDPQSGTLQLRSETGVFLRNGGESAIVTSDRAGSRQSLVLWLLTRPTTGVMYLQAYDALDLRHRLVSVAAGQWDNSGGYAGVSPTVVDGYVFVATDKRLTVWGCCRNLAAPGARGPAFWLLAIAALLAALAVLSTLVLRARRAR